MIQWHPQRWGIRFYLTVFLFFFAITLFGPKGIVHWILLKQESVRLQAKKDRLQKELQHLEAESNRFENSESARIHAIREELGYLQDHEISLEFSESPAGR